MLINDFICNSCTKQFAMLTAGTIKIEEVECRFCHKKDCSKLEPIEHNVCDLRGGG